MSKPFITIIGTVRKRSFFGIGPFRKAKWILEPYECSLSPSKPEAVPTEDLSFEVIFKEEAFVVMGKVKSTSCMFGQINPGDPQSFQFQMTSVAQYEVKGHVTVCDASL